MHKAFVIQNCMAIISYMWHVVVENTLEHSYCVVVDLMVFMVVKVPRMTQVLLVDTCCICM